MYISDLELTQATFEIFAGFIWLTFTIIVLINQHKSKSMRYFAIMFGTSAAIFFSEACAYIFRGNVDTGSIIGTRVSNFLVFILNVFLANIFVRYVYNIIQEKGGSPSKGHIIFSKICFGLVLAILLVNIFTKWMYYFDDDNFYHRGIMWYVYTAITVICLIDGCVIAILHRDKINRIILITVIILPIIPIVAILITAYLYGFAITNVGIGLGILNIFIVYLIQWGKSDVVNNRDDIEQRRKLLQVILLFIIMVVSMSASIISCIVSIMRISNETSESDSKVVAALINDSIENEFLRPITVAETMSKDNNYIEYMRLSGSDSPYAVEAEVSEYMESIRSGFGYQMVYGVAENSNAYYTYNGIAKFVDIENDEHDIWYRDFIASGKNYELNVDTDEANNWDLSVFVNVLVNDENGDLLGACGIGVDMDEIQEMIRRYEEAYSITIYLVNKDGLVQVSSNGEFIERKVVDASYFDKVGNDSFYYEKLEGECRLTKYNDILDWYIVVEDINPNKINTKKIILPSVIIFVAGLLVMGVTFGVITVREEKSSRELKEKRRASITDELTGLLNRHAYEEKLAELEETGKIHDMVYIMLDVNGLKTVNDNIGHNAGDELIIGAAKCMVTPFIEFGEVYRIGGDEFFAILKCSKDKVMDAAETFDHITSNWKGKLVNELAVSKGIVIGSEHKDLSLKEMTELADKLMYEDKEAYYKRTGKTRRK